MSGAVGALLARRPSLPNGNTWEAAQYGAELRDVIERQARRQPRSLQTRLGPSELGYSCDRRVIGKMAGQPHTGHIVDPWASIVGTGAHAVLAEFFARENLLNGTSRWLPENRVTPFPLPNPGTADLYDQQTRTVVDWKLQGPSTQAQVKSAAGPPRNYVVQLLLYALGYRNAGYQVDRVCLVSLPRTGYSLSGMYVWERVHTAADDILLSEVITETQLREAIARRVQAGEIPIEAVPRDTRDCSWCPFHRPEAAVNPAVKGCPGHSARG
jgi:PD-(D/E)XK nuclease superfamily